MLRTPGVFREEPLGRSSDPHWETLTSLKTLQNAQRRFTTLYKTQICVDKVKSKKYCTSDNFAAVMTPWTMCGSINYTLLCWLNQLLKPDIVRVIQNVTGPPPQEFTCLCSFFYAGVWCACHYFCYAALLPNPVKRSALDDVWASRGKTQLSWKKASKQILRTSEAAHLCPSQSLLLSSSRRFSSWLM